MAVFSSSMSLDAVAPHWSDWEPSALWASSLTPPRKTSYLISFCRGDSCGENNLSPEATIRWKGLYPRILSFNCDVLTIVDSCHAGSTALTPSHIAAVNKLYPLNISSAKEIIAAAGFQTLASNGQQYSLVPVLHAGFASHRVSGNLDSSTFFTEISFRMKELYQPSPPIVTVANPRRIPEDEAKLERGTAPYESITLRATAGEFGQHRLEAPAASYLARSAPTPIYWLYCHAFSLPLEDFNERVREREAKAIDTE